MQISMADAFSAAEAMIGSFLSASSRFRIFSFISAAAALVKVITRKEKGSAPSRISLTILSIMTAVLPLPAAAEQISLCDEELITLCWSSVHIIKSPIL